MGGGSSKKEPDNQTAEKYDSNFSTFRQEREKYVKRLEILNSLPKEKIDEILESTDPSNDGIKNLYSNIFKSIDKKYTSQKTFSESEVKNGIREMMVEQALINANILTEYDIEKQIKIKSSKYIDPLLKKYGSQTFNDIFNNIFNNYYYPINQKATLSTTDPKKIFDDDLCNACYSNLKFNKKFLVDCSIFIIDNLQICDSNHCKKLSEIIACNTHLKTLVLIFRKDITMRKELNEFNKVFEAIKFNESIRSLFIFSEDSKNEIKLSSQIENYIIDIVKTKKLLSLIIGKMITSSKFLNDLSSNISSNNKSLKAFGYFVNPQDKKSDGEINNFIKRILNNSTIKIFIFGGTQISNEKIQEYEKLKLKNNIKIFEVINDFNVEI
jgi:hypothetical protein